MGLIVATVCLLSSLAGAILSPVDGPLLDGLAAHHPAPGETQSNTRTVAPLRLRMIDQMRMANLAYDTQYATIPEIRRPA